MILHSSIDSIKKNYPTVLSILESFIATGISLYIAWKIESTKYMLFSAIFAPFLLLRSSLSIRYTSRLIQKYFSFMDDRAIAHPIIASIFVSSAITTVIMASKLYSITRVILRYPSLSISRIPENFYKSIFTLDLFTQPNPVPGQEYIGGRNHIVTSFGIYDAANEIYKNMVSEVFKKDIALKDRVSMLLVTFLLVTVFIGFFIISILVRFSVKSTVIIWLPLLWLIKQSSAGTNVVERINVGVSQPWFKIVLSYSIFVIIIFAIKIYTLIAIIDDKIPQSLGILKELATRIIDPSNLPLWHIMGALNGFLTIVFYLRSKRHLIARNTSEEWPLRSIELEFQILQSARNIISMYTSYCLLLIMLATSKNIDFSAIKINLVP